MIKQKKLLYKGKQNLTSVSGSTFAESRRNYLKEVKANVMLCFKVKTKPKNQPNMMFRRPKPLIYEKNIYHDRVPSKSLNSIYFLP